MKTITLTLTAFALSLAQSFASPAAPREVAGATDKLSEEEVNLLNQAISDAKSKLAIRKVDTDPFGLYQEDGLIPRTPAPKAPVIDRKEQPKERKIEPPTLSEALKACLKILVVDEDRNQVVFICNGQKVTIPEGQPFSFKYDRAANKGNLPKGVDPKDAIGVFEFHLKLLEIKPKTLLLEDQDKQKAFEILWP